MIYFVNLFDFWEVLWFGKWIYLVGNCCDDYVFAMWERRGNLDGFVSKSISKISMCKQVLCT